MNPHCTAFEGQRRIAVGDLGEVALKAKALVDRGGSVLIFDDDTGQRIEVDFRGGREDVLRRLAERALPLPEEPYRGRGRPKLGVVAREITLLPRHWEWLNSRPGGASVTLRRLVDEARRASEGPDRLRQGQDALYQLIQVLAGNEPGYEEATRALFAYDRDRFEAQVGAWPGDVRDYARRLADKAFPSADPA